MPKQEMGAVGLDSVSAVGVMELVGSDVDVDSGVIVGSSGGPN
jgi:hypothetical protein